MKEMCVARGSVSLRSIAGNTTRYVSPVGMSARGHPTTISRQLATANVKVCIYAFIFLFSSVGIET